MDVRLSGYWDGDTFKPFSDVSPLPVTGNQYWYDGASGLWLPVSDASPQPVALYADDGSGQATLEKDPTGGLLVTLSPALNTIGSRNQRYDGNAGVWRDVAGPYSGSVASAARSASTALVTVNTLSDAGGFARAVICALTVATMPGAPGGIRLRLQVYDPLTAGYTSYNQAPAYITTTGTFIYIFGQGSAGSGGAAVEQVSGLPVPCRFRLYAEHADAKSYTYGIGYQILTG